MVSLIDPRAARYRHSDNADTFLIASWLSSLAICVLDVLDHLCGSGR